MHIRLPTIDCSLLFGIQPSAYNCIINWQILNCLIAHHSFGDRSLFEFWHSFFVPSFTLFFFCNNVIAGNNVFNVRTIRIFLYLWMQIAKSPDESHYNWNWIWTEKETHFVFILKRSSLFILCSIFNAWCNIMDNGQMPQRGKKKLRTEKTVINENEWNGILIWIDRGPFQHCINVP